ncbi:MAG: HAMP domain-containing histidine kinase [Butyrivibrio sp.]|nr:HAMP domain-containing histidine kinase [Acetatifactor muris]MCM1558103.1 HAMP domain-containing histidine kinase [Butyrivibrio sp.]MCM1560466.1 HAMP domain-containing histidine kinase [Butyrivibrio sp.]
MGYIIILIFFAVALIFAGKYYGLKQQLKSVSRQLDNEIPQIVTVELSDKDLEAAILEINKLLEKMQQTVIKNNMSSATLKSSIADISHDMKTPLTSVIGYLQLADKECKDKKEKEIINICLERTRYCNELINEFFELSLLESQGCTPQFEKVDAAGILCEQILANQPVFEKKNIFPHCEDLDRPVIVSADYNMLNRVIQNLISNAVKYTDGDITFHIGQENKKAIITVSNSVKDYVDVTHVFDRFYTQDKSRNKGSGIGLYLCRQFIEAMGGSISAEMDRNCLFVKVILNQA